MKLSVVGIDDFLAAGKKCVAGKEVSREAGLLVISCDWVPYPAVFAGLKIAQPQAAFRFVARDVQHAAPVGQKQRPEAASQLADQDVFVAGFAVAPCHLP